jgi:serine/threonine protein kinase
MSFCLNPDCPSPQNSGKAEHCTTCGTELRLKQRYRAIAAIGQGGFGRTFLAIDEDRPSQPRCVIKQFFPAAGDRNQKKAAELFAQEARRLEELGNHAQIPTLLAYFSQQQQYLVQEFIQGSTLADRLEAQGAFTETQVRSVLTSLLPVLEFIHAHQVIHRDIKPANIIAPPGSLLLGSGDAVIFDWHSLLQALSHEAASGFRDVVIQAQPLGHWLSDRLTQAPNSLAIADYQRCQDLAAQFARYPRLSAAQRQYLVADASRVLYELRRKHSLRQPGSGVDLVLVDFGAAKAINAGIGRAKNALPTGTAIGSPGFTAPEQARGKAVFASDLYGLGVTCLNLLTHTSPLDLFDPEQNTWIWPQYLLRPVSETLTRILNKLIEPGLNRRYASAIDVLRDLEPSTTAPSVPPMMQLPPQPPLHPSPQPVVPNSVAAPMTGRLFRSPGKVLAIVLSPTQPLLVSSSGTTIKLWDLQTGQPSRTLTGHLDLVTALAISSDGSMLISGSADKTIKLWELPSGKRLASLSTHTDTVLAVAIASDGQTLASSSVYDPIALWDLSTGRECDRFYGHTDRVTALAFSQDSKRLISGGNDALIKLWDLETGQERTLPGQGDRITSLALSPDGKTLASGSVDGLVCLWSLATRRRKRNVSVTGRVNALAFTPDGKVLLTGSESLQRWSVRSGKELDCLAASAVRTIAISPIHLPETALNCTIAIATPTGTIRVWQ